MWAASHQLVNGIGRPILSKLSHVKSIPELL